jgi:hypothetical protein
VSRRYDFNGAGVPIQATSAQSLVFTQADIPSEQVVALHFVFQGAGNDLGMVERIRVTANGSSIINCDRPSLIAWVNTFSRDKALMQATDTRFTVPLNLMDAFGPDAQDVCQFPRQAAIQIELQTDSTTGAGRCFCGWTETDIDGQLFPKLLGSQMNIPASAANARWNFGDAGIVKGIYFDHAGLQRAKVTVGGRQAIEGPSLDYQGVVTGDMLAEFMRLEGAGQNPTVPMQRIDLEVPAPISSSYVELETGGGWGGVSEEATLYSLAPNFPAGQPSVG